MAQGATLSALLGDEKAFLKHYASQSGGLNRLVLVLGIVQCLSLVSFAGLLSYLVDSAVFSQTGAWQSLWLWGALLFTVVVRALASSAKDHFANLASIKKRAALRCDVLALVNARGSQLIDNNISIDLTNALNREIDNLKPYFANYLPQKQLAVLAPLIILLASLSINWVVPLIYLATVPFVPLFMVLVGKKAAAASKANLDTLSRLGNLLSNRLQGIPTLKAFGVIEEERNALHDQSDQFRQSTMKVLRLAFLSGTLLEFFSAISVALVAVYLGMLFLGKYELGMWQAEYGLFSGMFLLMLAPEFYLPMRRLGAFYHAAADAKGVAQHLAMIFAHTQGDDVKQDNTNSDVEPLPQAWKGLPMQLEVLDLEVGYNQSAVLVPVSFSVKSGEALLLSAPSGAGKSTLLDTLAGLKKPINGQVVCNGESAFEHAIGWSSLIGYMPQHPELLHDTIRNNLCLGKDYPDQSLWEALAKAQLAELVQGLPEQLGFLVTDQGGY
ncbi:MAG: ABC transporter ATP-binding protein/permease, partial [Pontibacterium sp.]